MELHPAVLIVSGVFFMLSITAAALAPWDYNAHSTRENSMWAALVALIFAINVAIGVLFVRSTVFRVWQLYRTFIAFASLQLLISFPLFCYFIYETVSTAEAESVNFLQHCHPLIGLAVFLFLSIFWAVSLALVHLEFRRNDGGTLGIVGETE